MDRIRESPRVLQVFAVAWLAAFVLGSLLYGGGAPIRIYAWALIILLVAALFLLRGSRVAWSLFMVGTGAAAVSRLPGGHWPWGLFYVALLVVLTTPEVRRYVWSPRRQISS